VKYKRYVVICVVSILPIILATLAEAAPRKLFVQKTIVPFVEEVSKPLVRKVVFRREGKGCLRFPMS